MTRTTNGTSRRLTFWVDDDGLIIEEKTRLAPRKWDTQRIWLTPDELRKILAQYEAERAVVKEGV